MSQPDKRSQSSSSDEEDNENTIPSQQSPSSTAQSESPSQTRKAKVYDPNSQQRSTKVAPALAHDPFSRTSLDTYDEEQTDFDIQTPQPEAFILPSQLLDQTHDLISTGVHASNIMGYIYQIRDFFENARIPVSHDFSTCSSHGIFRDPSLQSTCKFFLKLFQDSEGQLILYCIRQQGCGIAFSRLFKQVNISLSNEPERQIWTFEPPQLTASIDQVENNFSPFSPVFSPAQLDTATATITNLYHAIIQYRFICAHKLAQAPTQAPTQAPMSVSNLEESQNLFSFTNLENAPLPSSTAPVQLGKSIEQLKQEQDEFFSKVDTQQLQQQHIQPVSYSIPPSVDAQAHMFNQSFETLNDFLVSCENFDNEPVIQFIANLLTPQISEDETSEETREERYPMLMFFLTFPVISVRAIFVRFLELIVPYFQQFIAEDENNVLIYASSALDFSDFSPYDQLYRSQIHESLTSFQNPQL